MRPIRANLALLLLAMQIAAQTTSSEVRTPHTDRALPIVVMMAPPTYPVSVRVAHVEGLVRLRVTTDGRYAKDVQIQGNAPSLLARLSERNVRTWSFEPGNPTEFSVVYRYVLVNEPIEGADGASVRLELPTGIEIRATRVQLDSTPGK